MNPINEVYILPFSLLPSPYKERNNKSAGLEGPYVIESVASLWSCGVVKKLHCKPHCVNPLTEAARMLEGQVKKRLCTNLSRHVNLLLKQEAMTMITLEKSLELIMPGDWMATYDLTSAFHHIPIHPDFHMYLGFSIETEKVEMEYYAYTYMLFRLATGTQCLGRVTRAITRYKAAQGIKNCLYINDGRRKQRIFCRKPAKNVSDLGASRVCHLDRKL